LLKEDKMLSRWRNREMADRLILYYASADMIYNSRSLEEIFV
jgi:hypothetical protein